MDAPRSCKCGKELLPAEIEVRSGLLPKEVFGCVECGATLAVFSVFDVFGIEREPDLAVWLDEWSEEGGAGETLSVFLRRALDERRKKTEFSSAAI